MNCHAEQLNAMILFKSSLQASKKIMLVLPPAFAGFFDIVADYLNAARTHVVAVVLASAVFLGAGKLFSNLSKRSVSIHSLITLNSNISKCILRTFDISTGYIKEDNEEQTTFGSEIPTDKQETDERT